MNIEHHNQIKLMHEKYNLEINELQSQIKIQDIKINELVVKCKDYEFKVNN